jgi:hypothetical protein
MKGFMSKIYLESYRSELPPADYKVTRFEWFGSALQKYPAIRLNSHVIMQCSPWTLMHMALGLIASRVVHDAKTQLRKAKWFLGAPGRARQKRQQAKEDALHAERRAICVARGYYLTPVGKVKI